MVGYWNPPKDSVILAFAIFRRSACWSGPPPTMVKINSRTATAPIVAFTMACLLFVYSRTSIKAAKRNAERHRMADGGQISWQNENQRRHGKLQKPEDQDTLTQLILGTESKVQKALGKGQDKSQEGDKFREALTKRRGP